MDDHTTASSNGTGPEFANLLPRKENLPGVVDALLRKLERRDTVQHVCQYALPSEGTVIAILDLLAEALFPGYFGTSELTGDTLTYHVGSTLDRIRRELQLQVWRGLCFACEDAEAECSADCELRAGDITNRFLERLPEVRRLLSTDVRAAYEGDPAATSPDEAIFCYPGVLAITNYRVAHELYQLGVPLIPRIINEHAHSQTGIDIHPGATIGERFCIDHGTGVVIGETTEIGTGVKIYQGVSLGALSVAKSMARTKRHPTVEDNVVIYSNATILGGKTVIGHDSVIGGNVWLTESVAPHSVVFRTSEIKVRSKKPEGNPMDFQI